VPKYSSGVEDYLKAILHISGKGGYARTKDIAEELKVKPPSVTEMVVKMAKDKLVDYEKYGGVRLTRKGEKLAKLIKERQEVIESLFELMLVPGRTAKKDSCKLEHQLSPETLSNLKLFLKFLKSKGHYEKLKKDFKKTKEGYK